MNALRLRSLRFPHTPSIRLCATLHAAATWPDLSVCSAYVSLLHDGVTGILSLNLHSMHIVFPSSISQIAIHITMSPHPIDIVTLPLASPKLPGQRIRGCADVFDGGSETCVVHNDGGVVLHSVPVIWSWNIGSFRIFSQFLCGPNFPIRSKVFRYKVKFRSISAIWSTFRWSQRGPYIRNRV